MELKPNMYVRTDRGKIGKFRKETGDYYELEYPKNVCDLVFKNRCLKASYKITDLIEYYDLLIIENKVKDINNKEIHLFNPVRCDGFTTFEGNEHCIIINMDYIIPIENIKVKRILTHEQFESISYKVD